VIAVGDPQGDGGAEGLAAADATTDGHLVLFDPHAAAPAVTVLPPGQFAGEEGGIDPEPRRHAAENRRQPGPVALAGGH
jgi:hypothetical protein